ncbi:MAG: SGNH/GDSL hydrolase family protein [Chloroflexota bacterium]
MNLSRFEECLTPVEGSDVPLLWQKPNKHPFRLSGFSWFAHDGIYRRLPLKGSQTLPESVDKLAYNTAGGQISFQTDSLYVAIRVELAGLADMNHMPATGQCGFDLYVGSPLAQRFYDVTAYDHTQTMYEMLLFEHSDKEVRNFTINFPLYQGVNQVQIGLEPDANLTPPIPWSDNGKLVFYGTSITQGGCASRPGMAHLNILSRALNLEIVNLGFSGAGRGEPEVIRMMAEVPDPQLFVLDYESNSGGNLPDTLAPAIRILRDKHATVPIMIISRIAFAGDAFYDDWWEALESGRDMQAALVNELREAGDSEIYFVDGSKLLGADFDECTVDGFHPNDLGFMRMAKRLEQEIGRILTSPK